jgi:bacillopeptidase F
VGTRGFAVVGVTSPDAFVTVDGIPVLVDERGLFVQSIGLLDGKNLASVVVSDFQGNKSVGYLLVLATAPTEALPLHLLWPQDGVNVEDGAVTVIGVTPPDAIVTVNGGVVSVDVVGVFRVVLLLEEGPNIIEVIASDLLGNATTVQRTVVWVK